jgi:hypothetical protein
VHSEVLVMAMHHVPNRNLFLDIVGDVDLRRMIADYLPIASCSALLSVHRVLTLQGTRLIEILGLRLHHGVDKVFVTGDVITTVKVQITPFYKERIPHWQLRLAQTIQHCQHEVLVVAADVTSCLGTFAEVGNFMWNRDHNIDMLAVDSLNCAAHTKPGEYLMSSKFTNKEIRALHTRNYAFIPVDPSTNNQPLNAAITDLTVSIRRQLTDHSTNDCVCANVDVFKTLTIGLDLCNPHKRSIRRTGMSNEDCRSPVDSKPNAPFVSNIQLSLNSSRLPNPYKKMFHYHCLDLNHNVCATFASFGVAAVSKPKYKDASKETQSRLNEIVAKLVQFEEMGFNSLHYSTHAQRSLYEQEVHFEYNENPPLF